MSNALAFQSTQFEVVDLNGQPWIQSRQLAQALGYSSEKSVSNLYKRNSDEFSNEMSVVINLMTTNGQQEARIFSLRGCYAIAMFARTAIAKSFRVWVLDVLEKLNQQDKLTASPVPQPLPSPLATPAQRRPLDKLVKVWATLLGGGSGIYSRLWTQVDSHLGLISIDSATPEQVRQGIAFVQSKVDALQQKALPQADVYLPAIGHDAVEQDNAHIDRCVDEIGALMKILNGLWFSVNIRCRQGGNIRFFEYLTIGNKHINNSLEHIVAAQEDLRAAKGYFVKAR